MTEREEQFIEMMQLRVDGMREYCKKAADRGDEYGRIHYAGWMRGYESALITARYIFKD